MERITPSAESLKADFGGLLQEAPSTLDRLTELLRDLGDHGKHLDAQIEHLQKRKAAIDKRIERVNTAIKLVETMPALGEVLYCLRWEKPEDPWA